MGCSTRFGWLLSVLDWNHFQPGGLRRWFAYSGSFEMAVNPYYPYYPPPSLGMQIARMIARTVAITAAFFAAGWSLVNGIAYLSWH